MSKMFDNAKAFNQPLSVHLRPTRADTHNQPTMTWLPLIAIGVALQLLCTCTCAAAVPPPRTTPVLGWNAWNTFSVNGKPMRGGRAEYETVAQAMLDSGMVKAGYTLVSTVCTGWQERDPVTHALQENLTNWPGGMKSFAGWLHDRGMQLSVYTDAGVRNCCGEPGSLNYEGIDMKTFAAWDVDAVGIDYCGGPPDVQGAYQKFADGIDASGRDMQLGMWNLGAGEAFKWGPSMSQNMTAKTAAPPARRGSWVPHLRLTPDIGNVWSGKIGPTMSVMATVDRIQGIPDLWSYGMGNASGTYPNYGQMTVGVPKDHPTAGDPGLTLVEAQSHFSLWCMFASLLLATNDVRKRDAAIENILFNPETLAVNQDPWALPAVRVDNACAGEMWTRPLSNGDVAVLILNRQNTTVHSRISFDAILQGSHGRSVAVRDLQGRTSQMHCAHADVVLEPHQTSFVRLSRNGSTACTPTPPAPCTPPQPVPPPPAPPPHPQPGKPLPPCPADWSQHASGYWQNPDQRQPTGHSMNITACAALCQARPGCSAFEVYDPWCSTEPASGGGSACYTFSKGLGLPFHPDDRGLIQTCVKK